MGLFKKKAPWPNDRSLNERVEELEKIRLRDWRTAAQERETLTNKLEEMGIPVSCEHDWQVLNDIYSPEQVCTKCGWRVAMKIAKSVNPSGGG